MTSKKRTKSAKVELSEQHVEEIQDAFALCDHESTGEIDAKDLKDVIRALGFEPRKSEIDDLKKAIAQRTGNKPENIDKITLEQFTELMAPKFSEKDSRAEMARAFRLFDDDQTNTISFNNLKRVAKELGENISDDELREMIAEADAAGKGEVTEEDFYKIMKKTCLY